MEVVSHLDTDTLRGIQKSEEEEGRGGGGGRGGGLGRKLGRKKRGGRKVK